MIFVFVGLHVSAQLQPLNLRRAKLSENTCVKNRTVKYLLFSFWLPNKKCSMLKIKNHLYCQWENTLPEPDVTPVQKQQTIVEVQDAASNTRWCQRIRRDEARFPPSLEEVLQNGRIRSLLLSEAGLTWCEYSDRQELPIAHQDRDRFSFFLLTFQANHSHCKRSAIKQAASWW